MALRTISDRPVAPDLQSLVSNEEDGRVDRLVQAAAQLISARGAAAASARSVAVAAAVSPSAINYNFGGIEQLFSSVFDHGAALTAEWLAARDQEIRALPRTADGAAQALEYVLCEWTRSARPLALLYQERLDAAPGGGAAWTRLWRDHWLRTAAAFGLGEVEGRLAHLFFETEALHRLSTWSPALERAAEREMGDHFAAVWLGAGRRAGGGAFALAERATGARPHGSVAPAAFRIAEAAAEVVEKSGLAGLTHRAVAARAGVTTGAVTHHFRTVEDLVAGAIRGQVITMTEEAARQAGAATSPSVDDVLTAEALFEAMRFHATADPPSPAGLGRRRLFLATLRRPDLARAGAAIRFSYGGTLRDPLGRVLPIPADAVALEAGLLSRLASTLAHACAADPDPAASRDALFGEIVSRFMRGLGGGM